MGDSGLPLADLLETLVIERSVAQSEQNRTKVCPNCGNTVDGVEQAGEVGCSVCYMVFAKEIDRVVRELHGRAHQ
jgi:protein-arginine kinase activator protein McsA